MTVTIIALYLATVLSIGLFSHRLLKATGEDWFLATRSIGPFLLLMSLFGTHMTAFSLLGASAEAYRRGVGVFALMASSSAIVAPLVFWFVGVRLWSLGKRHGYTTQVQFFRERWQSPAVGYALFPLLVGLLVPYLLVGVLGGGVTLAQITEGAIPQWAGSLAIVAVVLGYVTLGGLRGTAWANAFQTCVFMLLGALTFGWIVSRVGGLEVAMQRVAAEAPQMLVRGEALSPLKMATYAFIPLSVGMFPHIFMHWLTARRASSFRLPMIAYPLCIAIVWVPSVLLGMIGKVEIPGLEGPAASSVLVQMIQLHAPGALAGLLAAGVFAAIMSSLDSQVLALGTMFTKDLLAKRVVDERKLVRTGRLCVIGILGVTYLLSLVVSSQIFKFGIWSFTGYAGLFPIVVAALFWRRSTAVGALAAIATVAVLWVVLIVDGWSVPGYTVGGTGVMPVAVIVAASSLAMVVGSLASRPPERSFVARFFADV